MIKNKLNSLETNHRRTRILIADDEALARTRINKFLSESKYDFQIFESSNGKETLSLLDEEKPDIVFLDIKMTDMTGFDVLRQLPKESIPIIIFSTAFDVYAVKAFEVQAIDFLLKPYKKERFLDALERGLTQLELNSRKGFQDRIVRLMKSLEEGGGSDKNDLTKSLFKESVVLKKNKKYYFVAVNDIKYISSSSYYAEIHTIDGHKHLHRISLNQFMEQLNPAFFLRINRSTIVPLNNIKEIISEGFGDYSIKMNDNLTFPLSKNFKSDVLNKLGIR